jgi:hypothetical protein
MCYCSWNYYWSIFFQGQLDCNCQLSTLPPHVAALFLPELQWKNTAFEDMHFQQDGTISHTAKTVVEFLHQQSGDNHLSVWSHSLASPYLTPPDFFLWGFLKSKVYKTCHTCIDELKTNITATISTTDQGTQHAVMNNMLLHCQECNKSNGVHLPSVILRSTLCCVIT